MNGYELDSAMRRDPHTARHYIGTFAADTLPRCPPCPALLLTNNKKSNNPGEHWLAIALDAQGRGQYFDSYGRFPVVKEHHEFMNRNCTRWDYNETCLQSVGTSVCGQHCVMYLLHRAHGLNLSDYIQTYFSPDTSKNDKLVNVMFHHYMEKMPLCNTLAVSHNKQKSVPRKK